MLPFASTSTVTFSGFVCVGMFTAFGRFCTTVLVITGIVIRKMINSTSITSTRGVVLMVEFSSVPSSSPDPTLIAIVEYLEWNLVSKRYKRQLSPFLVLLANGGCRRGHRAGSATGCDRVAGANACTTDQVRMQVRSEVAQAVLHTLV